jgi:hypothetical protein
LVDTPTATSDHKNDKGRTRFSANSGPTKKTNTQAPRMNTTTIIVSAITAFIIAFTGSMIVVLVGGKPTPWQILTALGVGLAVSAKDTRSLLKLPPVNNDDSKP